MIYCRECGKELPDTANFCSDCGAQQGDAEEWYRLGEKYDNGEDVPQNYENARLYTAAAEGKSRFSSICFSVSNPWLLLFPFLVDAAILTGPNASGGRTRVRSPGRQPCTGRPAASRRTDGTAAGGVPPA